MNEKSIVKCVKRGGHSLFLVAILVAFSFKNALTNRFIFEREAQSQKKEQLDSYAKIDAEKI